MVQLSPKVRDDWWTGCYKYDQTTIKGFSHTHLSGSGISEGTDITLAPTTGEPRFVPGKKDEQGSGYRSSFRKETEQARLGCYSVILDDYGIKTELTATTRSGMHRYTFPKTTMSAWYVMSAMGFYPVCPSKPEYIITTPLFEKMTLKLENGKEFTIEAPGRDNKKIYIKSATLNGKPYTKSFISNQDIVNGGVLSFEVSDTPDKSWGTAKGDVPVSFIEDEAANMPIVVIEDNSVIGKKRIALETTTPSATIYYTLDGTDPSSSSSRYNGVIELDKTTEVRAVSSVSDMNDSYVSKTIVTIRNSKYPIVIENLPVIKHHELMVDGSSYNLIDGILGATDAYNGSWVYSEGRKRIWM